MSVTAAIILSLQLSGQGVYVPEPDNPETWVIEYPRIIQEDIAAYYGCLRSRGVSASGTDLPEFEDQHRAHIPLCAKQFQKSLTSANATLSGRKHYAAYTPERIEATLKSISYIHIRRGRDLDNRLRLHLKDHVIYDQAYQQTPEQVSGGERIDADLPPQSSQESTPDAQN